MMSDPNSSFWSSMSVYIERPNLINKRLMGCHFLNCWQINLSFDEIYVLMTNCLLNQLKDKLKDCKQLSDFKMNQIQSYDGMVLIVRQLILKQSLKSLCSSEVDTSRSELIDFVLIDIPNTETIFVPKVCDNHIIPGCCHKLFLNQSQEIQLKYLSDSADNIWLNQKVLPKLNQWMNQELEGNQSKGSLQLIPVDQYCLTYNRLKTRYGQPLVQLWAKYETTDPLKFVFEDIAIASYLIVLWNQQNLRTGSNRKQTFIDIGCGNGLLVYLLSNEGYKGLGIDLRKRNIWDKYEPKVDLIEKVFTPSDESLVFDDYDWLIGNHSDELTPWIPYIASKSGTNQSVFLLPCCPFDFNGSKYQRTSSNLSQYNCYINYLESICQTFGFDVQTDKLRIPSTKRICLVCTVKNFDKSSEIDVKNRSKQLVEQKLTNFVDYKPRDKVEAVRNCTRVPKDILNTIVTIIANQLIEGNTEITISSLPNLLTDDIKRHLKSQCGGLQTLLRNHKNIFEVRNGLIVFTRPKPMENSLDNKTNLKSKQCWFFHNHPDGCPLTDNHCRYIH